MKKSMIVLLALLMAVGIFAGCEVKNPLYDGSSAAPSISEPESSEVAVESSEVSEGESSADKNTASLADNVSGDSDEAKVASYVAMNRALAYKMAESVLEESNMNFTLEARGTSVVYSYIMKDIENDSTGVYAEYFDVMLESTASIFENVVNEVKNTGVSETSVIVEYWDNNGGMIYSREYQ